jgi:hypothetical protein
MKAIGADAEMVGTIAKKNGGHERRVGGRYL